MRVNGKPTSRRTANLVNAWGDSNCKRWLTGHEDRCDSGNYKRNCTLACSQLRRPSSGLQNIFNIWDDRDCMKWVFNKEHRCKSFNYQTKCRRTCHELGGLPATRDSLPALECQAFAQLDGGAGCALYTPTQSQQRSRMREQCSATCAAWLSAPARGNPAAELRVLGANYLECGNHSAGPTLDLRLEGEAVGLRNPVPSLFTNRLNNLWSLRLSFLQRVTALLDEFSLEYILESGTLLGALRHGGPIPYDDDFDILILAPIEKVKRSGVLKEMKKRGIRHRPGSFDCNYDLYKPICAVLKSMGRPLSDGFAVLADAQFPEVWIDVGLEVSFEMAGGHSARFFGGMTKMIDADVLQSWLRPLQRCAFGQREYSCPANPKAWLCAEMNEDIKWHGVWDSSARKWKVPDKWKLFNKSTSSQGQERVPLPAPVRQWLKGATGATGAEGDS